MEPKINWVRAGCVAALLALGVMVYLYSVEYRKARLAELRIKWLADRTDLLVRQGEIFAEMGRLFSTNVLPWMDYQTNMIAAQERLDNIKREKERLQWDALVELSERLEALEAAMTNRPRAVSSPYAAGVAPRAGATQMKDGVPLAVWQEIRAAAIKAWPGDYRMQEYEMRNQIEAWKKVHPEGAVAPATTASGKRR